MVVVIVDAVRSPFVASGGALSGWHPVTLMAELLRATADRAGVDPQTVSRVIGACATPVGEQALNITRNAVLAAGWPEATAATTVDAQQTSGAAAVIDAAALVASGAVALAVVAGVESASRVALGASTGVAVGQPFGPAVHERYESEGGLVSPGLINEALAERFSLSRSTLDAYAANSIEKLKNAQKTGVFKNSILAVAIKNARGVDTASSVSDDTIAAHKNMAKLLPVFETGGLLTSATFAHPADGAAALTLCSGELAAERNLPVIAEIVDSLLVGTSPIDGDSGATAVRMLLKRNGVKLKTVARFDVQETSAALPLAFASELGVDIELINPEGGALGYGTPAGAAGVALMGAAAHGLSTGATKYGVAVLAGAEGQTAAVLLRNP